MELFMAGTDEETVDMDDLTKSEAVESDTDIDDDDDDDDDDEVEDVEDIDETE